MADGSEVSRRGFALSAAAVTAVAATEAHAAVEVVATDVSVATPDGTCDAVLFHPKGKGVWPAVVIFTDILGLRPVFRDMGARMAAEGFVVLVPNPFYRTRKAPIIDGPFDFNNPTDRAKLNVFRGTLFGPGNVERDSTAYVAYLDGLKVTNRKAKVGVAGYCMGGPMTMLAAATCPERIGAGASFHGGGLATSLPSSPHLLVPKMKAQFYFGIAMNDDQKEPDAKTRLSEAFMAAELNARVEVYDGALHGWCVKGSAAYNEPAAERAWAELVGLYRRALT